MKQLQQRFTLFILLMLTAVVACQAQLEPAATGGPGVTTDRAVEPEAVEPEPTAVVAEGPLAYVQDNTLYIWPAGGEPLAVEPCPADAYCFLQYWYAVTGPVWSSEAADHQLATGLAEETAVTIIPTSNPVELIFFGPVSHKLYYTTRELVESAEISNLNEYFKFYRSALWQINANGSEETMLWQADDQAFAQLTESANGDIIFVRVENDRSLYEALQNGAATTENMAEFAPQRHIVRLAASGEPQPMIENAGQPQLTP